MSEEDGLFLNIVTNAAPRNSALEKLSQKRAFVSQPDDDQQRTKRIRPNPTTREIKPNTNSNTSNNKKSNTVGPRTIAGIQVSRKPLLYTSTKQQAAKQQKPTKITNSLQPEEQTNEAIIQKQTEIFEAKEDQFDMINDRMKQNLQKELNITRPTKIQLQALPCVLSGRDVLIKSKTGSGKTLAYLLPTLHLLQTERISRNEGTYVIVIVPTRELATQIIEVGEKLLKQFAWIVLGGVMGGEAKKKEKARLRKGLSVVVATPGRLLDHLSNTQSFNVSNLKWLVLDEADRLLDLGFDKVLRQIIQLMNDRRKPEVKRQNLLISATLDGRINNLANFILKKPVFVQLSEQHEEEVSSGTLEDEIVSKVNEEGDVVAFQVPQQLVQLYVVCEAKRKFIALAAFLRFQSYTNTESCKMLVFLLTTDMVEYFYALFSRCEFKMKDEEEDENESNSVTDHLFGVEIFKLHGNMAQKDRTSTFLKFRACKNGILFCTDVAARGLDVPNIKWIIQYDAPTETKEYVHRIGRTARFTGTGKSVLFLTPSEKAYIPHLNEFQLNLTEMDVKEIFDTLQIPLESRNSEIPKEVLLLQYLENLVTKDRELMELATNAFRSYTRGYSTYPRELKPIFHVRSLHLGHLAKSFALTQPPSQLDNHATKKPQFRQQSGNLGNPSAKRAKPEDFVRNKGTKKPVSSLNANQRILSEYSAF